MCCATIWWAKMFANSQRQISAAVCAVVIILMFTRPCVYCIMLQKPDFQILDCGYENPLELERTVMVNEITCTGITEDHYVKWYLKWTKPQFMDYAEVGFCSVICHSDWAFVSIKRPTKTTSVIRIKGRLRTLGLSGVSCVDYNRETKEQKHYNCTITIKQTLPP